MSKAVATLVDSSSCGLGHLVRVKLSEILAQISETVQPYWWRLVGNHPESLCRLIQVSESEMMTILRAAEVISGKGDMIKMQKFEVLASLLESKNFDWSVY